jgi:hypothetical protein
VLIETAQTHTLSAAPDGGLVLEANRFRLVASRNQRACVAPGLQLQDSNVQTSNLQLANNLARWLANGLGKLD